MTRRCGMGSISMLVVAGFLLGAASPADGHWRKVLRPVPMVVEAPALPGWLDLDVAPESARVRVDGRDVGEVDSWDGFPRYLALKPGPHLLEFHHPGRQVLRLRVTVRSGIVLRIDREMLPSR